MVALDTLIVVRCSDNADSILPDFPSPQGSAMCGVRKCFLGVICTICTVCLVAKYVMAAEDPFASAIRPTAPLTPMEEQQCLHAPPGFRVQLFAAEPEIQKPLNMAFDGRGRLWVSGTQDYPFPNLKEPGDSIRVLEDTDGDGRADRITTFVDQVTIPMGLLPYRDGVIAFCVPNIWFFRDTDGDGQCDHRELLYGPFDTSRDTHGMNNAFRRGFDGWIYACHGYENTSVVAGKDGHSIRLFSGNTYRFRPDGSRIEQFTHGQVNPFGMTFDKRGDLFNSDCHTKPLTLLMRGGQYQCFGRMHDGLGFVPEIMHHSHGSTAIAGVTQATDERIPLEYQDGFYAGNVMTSRINRDTLKYSGSSMQAIEQADFLISNDPWFRPVDLQMGPDGALYIADFYNKIIGHYEVSLVHPERDRHRGRIWRVDYVGEGVTSPVVPRSIENLETAPLETLVAIAGTRNLPRRMRAIDEISDRLGTIAVPELLNLLPKVQDETTHTSLLWALQRQSALAETLLLQAAHMDSALVRLHAQKILAETAQWTPELRTAALNGLADSDAFVQRAAADALGRHPHREQVHPLLSKLRQCSSSDPILEHQLKISLRHQLQLEGILPELRASGLSIEDLSLLASICVGLDTRESAQFLLAALAHPAFVSQQLEQTMECIAKWVNADELQQLIQTTQSRFGKNLETQVVLFRAVHTGLRRQGDRSSELMRNWGENLVTEIFALRGRTSGWSVASVPLHSPSPWDFEYRASADGIRNNLLISSRPGGETAVSTLRSPDFELPTTLSFVVCGYQESPRDEKNQSSFVRLCLVENGQEICRAVPPGSDVAESITWDLSLHLGHKAYLEVVDGLDRSSAAWIAFGRISPPIVPFYQMGFMGEQQLLQSACQLITEMNLKDHSSNLATLVRDRHSSPETRQAAVDSFAKLNATPASSSLAALWNVPSLTSEQLDQVQIKLFDDSSDQDRIQLVREIGRTISTRYQVDVAQALVSVEGGAPLLLDLCESGAFSPRVLTSSAIHSLLSTTKDDGIQQRAKKVVDALPQASEERDQKIASLIKEFSVQSGNVAAGRRVFENRCASCHQIQGIGKIIGPQLDGIGNRGAERLFEDVIDPNRNVDISFRTRSYVLSNGKVYSGIFRRQEGPLIVIADNKGEEHSISENEIEEQVISPLSIMPDNWSEIVPVEDLYSLMAFLLEQRK